MLTINNLTYYIGGRPIYDEASLHIKPKDKIGLIGLNGTGKTTLLKIITGELTTDGGEISKRNDCTIGFLNQDLLSFQSDDSILEVAMQAFKEVTEIHHKIGQVLHEMEQNYSDKLLEKLNTLQEKFEILEGYSIQSKAEEILEGIGFETTDLERPLREFSGGWRMRVMLAKLLLEKPSLLMLDEPTNHLDLPSIQWIENYLRNYEGAVVVVSHDQEFINNTSETIVEVSGQKLNVYPGNYDQYIEEKELRNEIQQNAFKNQQQRIKQTERFIVRFRAKATKAKQVKSKIKGLEKMDKVDEVIDENIKVNFKFSFSQKSGRHVSTMEGLTKSYGDLNILNNTSGCIERGDKIALIGANGKGKSTLLRMIAGTEKFQGKCDQGYNVIDAFYAQHQLEALTINNAILDELKQSGSKKTELELRSILGCFLFTGDDVFKKIKVLSGGEKSRVALAKTLLSEANFLLLDEPTNHLDIQSVNILIQALQQYEGSFIIVSHNRHFIDQVANKIWWIENQNIKEYPGPYHEYAWWRSKNQVSPTITPVKSESRKKKEQHVKENSNQELSKLKKELNDLEERIEKLERNKTLIESELAKPEIFGNPNRLFDTNQKFQNICNQIDQLTSTWEKTGSEFEDLENASVK
ncbi:MAG: ABC-F family ATP-binding cassette domain-containing protein [Bacteroidetes bacterium]|nr:ABC-F family ATP-binding cassette domain-containing protein [Bacteroidota bacterium]MDA1120119.1 ABC-F family ATP-binding cassette domain-containing protein [Bacteroidota bacterium]